MSEECRRQVFVARSRHVRSAVVYKATEAWTVVCVGSDTLRNFAPSNAPARLLGGDTARLLSVVRWGRPANFKTGKLGATSLYKHRVV